MEAAGKVNLYFCKECKKSVTTLNINTGTTPFGIKCRYCESFNSYSSFYKLPYYTSIVIDYVWYRPYSRDNIPTGYMEHVLNGGLVLSPFNEFCRCLLGEPPDTQPEFFKWIQKAYGYTDPEFAELIKGIIQ